MDSGTDLEGEPVVRTFDEDGFRLRAGCVCFSADCKQVCGDLHARVLVL